MALEEIVSLMHGFSVALTPFNLALMFIGILLGVIIGVLPGLGGANGVAILLPLTFTMPPTSAIILLSCIYWGALFGGAITSILFNIPGEPWSVATTFDGHPMAQKGRADEALTAAFTSSFVGAFVAVILITFLAPLVAKLALKFGPAEFFAVFFLTFASFIGMGKGSPWKTLASMCLGFALGSVGLDKMTGTLRMTFGHEELLKGFDFLIAVIGLFGIGEILSSMESGLKFQGAQAKIRFDAVLKTWRKLLGYWATSIRSCIIGCWMGITPGGATPASFMSYGIAKRFSKNGDNFGKGEIEGVIAPETAAHAAGTSALLPMLTLGIPGSPTAAVLLGGLMIWGLQPGPMLFVEQKDFVWGLIASMYLGNIAGLIVVLTCVPLFAAILRVPFSIIAPVILVICAVGAYTVANAMFDVWLMLVFGVMGYAFQKLGYPLAPLVLAIVLGDKAEEGFRQALLGSQGGLGIFFSNPLVASIMGLGLILLFWPLLVAMKGRLGASAPASLATAAVGAATGSVAAPPPAIASPSPPAVHTPAVLAVPLIKPQQSEAASPMAERIRVLERENDDIRTRLKKAGIDPSLGTDTDEARRLQRLELENVWLKKLLAEAVLAGKS